MCGCPTGKERRVEKRDDKKLKVTKPFGNWLQAFAIMAGLISRHQPEKPLDLFVYLDTIYSADKLKGGTAWWRYDEEFRCHLAINPEVGWTSKATDLWISSC